MSKKTKTSDEKPAYPEIEDIDLTAKLLEICDRAAHDPSLKQTHQAARLKLAEMNAAIQAKLDEQRAAEDEAAAKEAEEAEAAHKAADEAAAKQAKADEAAAAKARAKETGYSVSDNHA